MSVTQLRPTRMQSIPTANSHVGGYCGAYMEPNDQLAPKSVKARWSRCTTTLEWNPNKQTIKEVIDQAIKETKAKLMDRGISATWITPTKIELGTAAWDAYKKAGI